MRNGTLETVQDYITDSRVLLQDTIQPYRYDDDSLLAAFNMALLEGRRLRPDLFIYRHGEKVPYFPAISGAEVCIEPQFRQAFVFGTCAHAMSRDQEDIQDTRATSFNDNFHDYLIGVRPRPLVGGAPPSAPPR